ncbi:MAG: leucine-rich repeat domain-containing protein [Eubacterium sp.]|nr:leucine-rich repeat domain-containing protein [Eubacterium sp.]
MYGAQSYNSSIDDSVISDAECIVYSEGITDCYNAININNSPIAVSNIKSVSFPASATYINVNSYKSFPNCNTITISQDSDSFTIENNVLFNKDKTVLYGAVPLVKSTYIVPDSVRTIEGSAFSSCKKLAYVELSENVRTIEGSAFADCTNLRLIEIPDGVKTIARDCFDNCVSLTQLDLPASVTGLGYEFCEGCSSLTAINVDSENEAYTSFNGVLFENSGKTLRKYPIGNSRQQYTIPNGVEIINEGAFVECRNLQNVFFPESLKSIGLCAFQYCTNLKAINLPNSVTSIGKSAFESCYNVEEIELSNSLESIPYAAFYNCEKTKEITVPSSVKSVYMQALRGINTVTFLNPDVIINDYNDDRVNTVRGFCNSTAQEFAENHDKKFVCLCTDGSENHDFEETIVPPAGDEKGYTLYTCKTCGYNYKSNVIKADEIVYSNGGKTLVSYSENLTEDTFEVPDTVTVIADDAFNNEYLKTIVISDNVKVIGNSAFENCPNLESIEFKEDAHLEQIQRKAFAGTRIKEIVVPETVTTIESQAFANCSNLESFDVEENVQTIADDSFENSKNVTFVCVYQSNSYKFASRKKIRTIAYTRIPDQTYTGKAIKPRVTIHDTYGNVMNLGEDYYVGYKNNINVGTAQMGVYGLGEYSGKSKTLSFKIVKPAAKVKASTLSVKLSATSYTYSGSAVTPGVIVKTGAGKTVSSANYTVSYPSARKNVGKYTVTINFKGDYTGSVSRTFKILPKGTSISKLSGGSACFTAKWNKQTAQVTGYQIQYCVRSNFSKAKSVKVKGAKASKKKISKVASKKKYYVRIRTYKTVNGKTYYSSWSKTKYVKTK